VSRGAARVHSLDPNSTINPSPLNPMKRSILFRYAWVWVSGLLLFLPACATTERPEVPGTLKVQVNVPPSWSILLDDRVSEVFVDYVREAFYRAGFDRPVEEVRYVEDSAKVPYLLTLNLNEWRINRVGNIDCTFSASLQTPRGTRDLGLFTNTTMRWFGGPGRFGLSRSFAEAADGAIGDLCDKIAKSELLPDFRKPKHVSGLRPNRGPSA
jgi:hypothetical protein